MDNSQLSDTQIKALTAISPQEVVVSSPQTTLDTNSGETRIRATGTNEKLTDGVYVKTYGVFAKDDTGNEILYGLTVSPNPNYFPAYDGVTPQAVTYSYKVNISNTSKITFTNSNDVYVSDTDLSEALQPYAKTVDVNQQLDKKVNIADMRKPVSDVAGIEEVNAKQDKIGYTPADDSKVVHNSGNEDIGGQKKFDVAPIDKTTGNPYITKDGVPAVPSTLADTTKLANFTGGLQSDGNYVVTTNQVNANIVQTIDPNADLFAIKQAGIYKSAWGNQNTLKNFPSPDGSATIIYSGSGNTDNGIQITVIDSWGSVFVSHWQGAASKPGYSAWQNVSNIANPDEPQTFTAAQTFSIAPTIKDASKDKGDNQAATMADLKSVEDSAWHDLKTTDVNGSFDMEILYQKIVSKKQLRFIFIADYKGDKDLSNYNFAIDLSKIITKFQTPWSGDLQVVHAVSDDSHMNYDFYAHSGSSLITCSQPITLSKDEAPMSFATSFLTTRTNGELNDTFYVDGFKS
ncbi:hypothetical protein LDJ81_03605 [Lentilactobacillus parabuchneri]|uniref:hypothetical protein n=1 Tax=Lentilactobacillus parabuchneri TaxID=152331 RepID=UPI0022358397|nr:hypothetical protein [Lentilactobacillus parabuchneri]MCW4398118.1 hypothetical protein [Lentilactobacillus parabuchneri]